MIKVSIEIDPEKLGRVREILGTDSVHDTVDAAFREFARIAAAREAVASARGSVAAEGLTPTDAFMWDAVEFALGAIDADELARRAVERHRKQAE